jgi:hypothetical protein
VKPQLHLGPAGTAATPTGRYAEKMSRWAVNQAKIEAERSGINYEEVRHRRAESTDSGSYRRLI